MRHGPTPGRQGSSKVSQPPINRLREGSICMSEATHTPRAKAKPAISGPAASAFEFPKFEIPNFEMPKLEVPAAFREFAEKGASQAKETYEKMKAAAEEATDVLEDTYA